MPEIELDSPLPAMTQDDEVVIETEQNMMLGGPHDTIVWHTERNRYLMQMDSLCVAYDAPGCYS